MKILTWNINSVRLRLPLLKKVIRDCDPDVICLQETKAADDVFPAAAIADLGYKHQNFHGMKSYNGVAVFSRLPLKARDIHHRAKRQDCRHVSVQIASKKFKIPVEIHCLYVPAGGDIPDPVANDKFAHKLDFVDDAGAWFRKRYKPDQPLILLGDLNIAPLEHDVWSHKQLLDVVSHTPVEVERFKKMQKSLDWHDAIRHFVPEQEKCYTWWSYRNQDWKKSNRGRRLDHIWVTRPLMPHLKSHEIHTSARDWTQPSDHVPVMVTVAL